MAFLEEVGRALRRARESRGLTLRQASKMSGGRFPPTSLASYERGERSISFERFCRLTSVYGIPPERLTAEIMRTVEGRPSWVLDLSSLERLQTSEAQMVEGFVRKVAMLRDGAEPGETVSLRVGDLEVLAAASGHRLVGLVDAILPALRDG